MNEDVPEWANSTQMTVISTTVGKNPLEEMEQIVNKRVQDYASYILLG